MNWTIAWWEPAIICFIYNITRDTYLFGTTVSKCNKKFHQFYYGVTFADNGSFVQICVAAEFHITIAVSKRLYSQMSCANMVKSCKIHVDSKDVLQSPFESM